MKRLLINQIVYVCIYLVSFHLFIYPLFIIHLLSISSFIVGNVC